MASITLSRAEVLKLHAFCVKHGKDKFFIAKDHGAYVGSSVGAAPEQQCLFYFRGCDPVKNPDFYDNAHDKFGGDDFGTHLPVSELKRFVDSERCVKMRITVNRTSIKLESLAAPAKG